MKVKPPLPGLIRRFPPTPAIVLTNLGCLNIQKRTKPYLTCLYSTKSNDKTGPYNDMKTIPTNTHAIVTGGVSTQ